MPYDMSSLSVLLIEDSRAMKKLLRDVLQNFGIGTLHTAADGQEALSRAAEHEPDIIIADWQMEPTDGLEFTRLVRRGEGGVNPFVPILMLTGHTERERVAAARDAGITEFLAKPVTPKSLYDRLVAIIERPRPFVRGPDFIGPDRRRRRSDGYAGYERRGTQDMIDI